MTEATSDCGSAKGINRETTLDCAAARPTVARRILQVLNDMVTMVVVEETILDVSKEKGCGLLFFLLKNPESRRFRVQASPGSIQGLVPDLRSGDPKSGIVQTPNLFMNHCGIDFVFMIANLICGLLICLKNDLLASHVVKIIETANSSAFSSVSFQILGAMTYACTAWERGRISSDMKLWLVNRVPKLR